MKRTTRLMQNLRIAAPFLLVLMLAFALLPGTVLAQPPGPGGPGAGPGGPGSGPPTQNPVTPTPTPVPTVPAGTPPGNGGPDGPGGGPPAATPTATPTPAPTNQPHPGAPFTPPANCIVAHAATPAQLCPIGGGLQYYFIGADGASSQGPWIAPFGQLTASVFSGTNPRTGKSVTITYLAAENKIRISTFYPDTQYDINKPYNFTVDANNNVSHEAW